MTDLNRKAKTRLSQNMWYHGTTIDCWDSFCKNGVLSDYNKDTSDALDFGYGFYLTSSKNKAENYIFRLMDNTALFAQDTRALILGFEFTPLSWFESDAYKTLILDQYDDRFADFVFTNRTENRFGQHQHRFDVIYGVMSDSNPVQIISEYRSGIISKQQALDNLKKSTSMKQISLHSQQLCDMICLKEAYWIDNNTKERKELDVHEYRNPRNG